MNTYIERTKKYKIFCVGRNKWNGESDQLNFLLNIFRIFKWAQVKRKPLIDTLESRNPTLFKNGNYPKWKWSKRQDFH